RLSEFFMAEPLSLGQTSIDHYRPITICAGLCWRPQITPTNFDLPHFELIRYATDERSSPSISRSSAVPLSFCSHPIGLCVRTILVVRGPPSMRQRGNPLVRSGREAWLP